MKDKKALLQALTTGAVTVNFVKADSTNREMKCTQVESLMTEYSYGAGDLEQIQADAESKGLVRAYDLEAQDWRSFKTDSVTSWAQA